MITYLGEQKMIIVKKYLERLCIELFGIERAGKRARDNTK
jgi:hypothetical protein